jgi:hypothetical protein
MLRRALAHAVVLAGISVMLGVLAVLDVGRVGPIAGAQYVDRMAYCPASSCEGAAQVQLPFLTSFRYDPGIERHVLQTAVQSAAEDRRVEAIYVPKYSDRLQIRVNGALIHTDPDRRRPWNAPLLIEVPPYLLMAGENIVTLVLTGDVPGRLDLHPISFGDQAVLSRAHAARQMLGPGATRFSLTMMGLLTLGFLVVWSNRPRDRLFLWIGLSCGCACMYLSLLAFSFSVGGYKNWKLLQSASMAGYALFMLAFVRAFLALPVLRSEKVLAGLVALGLVATFVVPIHLVNMTSMVVNISSVWAAVTIVVVMWERRRLVPTVDFLVFFPTLSLALAFAFDGLVHNLSGAPACAFNAWSRR